MTFIGKLIGRVRDAILLRRAMKEAWKVYGDFVTDEINKDILRRVDDAKREQVLRELLGTYKKDSQWSVDPQTATLLDIDMVDTTDVIELTSEDFGRVKAVLENPGEPNAKLTRLAEGGHE